MDHEPCIKLQSESPCPLPTLFRNVDLVFVDDDQALLASYHFGFGRHRKIELHRHPQSFLDDLPTLRRDTRIMLDFQIDNFHLNGVQIAAELHRAGFTRLYLVTGANLCSSDIPVYLTLVRKGNAELIHSIVNE
jgi:hypothetical protein